MNDSRRMFFSRTSLPHWSQSRCITARTPVTAEELAALLTEARAQEFAGVCDVIEYGVVAVSVPIRDAGGQVFAAINCSADSTRIRLPEMIGARQPALRAAAAEISTELQRFPTLAHPVAA